ncbi:hypothetical protein PEC18_03430 [Paucibacter sp. O1-1]|nr:hypothetical protein [Paucibacter sp. O1-1]MDA3824929.1 hypothetical protein [Paucibacter sp. O1-1]
MFEPRKHNYEAQFSTSTLTYGKLESEKFRLPLRQKLLAGVVSLRAPRAMSTWSISGSAMCAATSAFALTQDAVAKVTYQRLGAGGELLGHPVDLSLGEGLSGRRERG